MTAIRFALAILLSLAAFGSAAADKTDLWWNPNESGWGMTIANQGDTIFVTMYVYAVDNSPTWFVGTATLQSTDAQGVRSYGGDWYRVTGPYYGLGTFDPGAVNASKVGTYTYRELSATTGQIAYTVGTTTYTKNVQRQTLAFNPNVNGSFGGAYFSNVTGCSNASFNGQIQAFVTVAMSGTPASRSLTVAFQNGTGTSCVAAGPYAQSGRLGSMSGTWTCNNSITGTSTVTEIEAGGNTLTARFENHFSGCTEVGYFSAGRVLGG